MRILIAEDDQVLADGLLRTLRASGAVVDHVASGTEADAALLTNNEFDLLILDLGLPKMHGLEVLKKLRGRGSALPVLILTAADSVEGRPEGATVLMATSDREIRTMLFLGSRRTTWGAAALGSAFSGAFADGRMVTWVATAKLGVDSSRSRLAR